MGVLVQREREGGVKPQTVANYFSHLGAVFSIARAANPARWNRKPSMMPGK
jgi:hypothetical protein